MADGPPPFDQTSPAAEGPPPFEATKEPVGGTEAVLRGAAQGATFNMADELAGAHAAGPSWTPGIGPIPASVPRTVIGAGRVAAESLMGDKGDATKAYEERRDEVRAADEAAKKSHPYLHGAGELAGAIPAIAVTPEAGAVARLAPYAGRGAKFVAGALDSATQGGIYGGVSGAGEGTGLVDRAIEGAKGAASGVIGGALAHGAGEVAKAGYNKFGRPVVDTIRGWIDPNGEASRRLVTALKSDSDLIMRGKAQGMSPSEWLAARQAGELVTLADLGSSRTQALLRSAANTSPEGRAMLEQVIEQRFLSQADRVGGTVRNLIPGGADARKTGDQLVAEYDKARAPAYKAAYEQGDKPLMTPAMERLMSSDTFVSAMKRAISSGKDRDVAMGLGGFNPMVDVTADGRIVFNKGAQGAPTYPNLQYWDQVKRELDSVANQAKRSGDTSTNAGDLAKLLRGELDSQVPGYKKARGIAEDYFGESNALEAGRKLAGKRADPEEVAKALRQMDPQERQLFQEGYASDLANRVIDNLSQTRDLTKAIFHNNAERKMIATIFGAGGVRQMENRMAIEVIMDGSRKAMGNSTTARQLIEAGLAGGALSGYASGWDPVKTAEGAGAAATARFGAGKFLATEMASGAKHLVGKVDAKTARRVAELLTSDDPRLLREGYRMAAKNESIGQGLRALATRIGIAGQSQARAPVSDAMRSVQGAGPSAAQPNEDNRKRPRNNEPNQGADGKAHGGRIRRETGGAVKRALQSLKEYADGGAPEESAPFDLMSGVRVGADTERTEPEAAPNRYTRAAIQSIGGMPHSMMTLPGRAFDSARQMAETGEYDPGPVLEAAMLPMGTGALAGVPMRAGEAVVGAGPIRAYHGSPHDFDRFDISKIGTGEGAQAYGHGLYFAENEGVARSYRDALAPPSVIDSIGNKINAQSSGPERQAYFTLRSAGGDFDQAIKRADGATNPDEVQSVLKGWRDTTAKLDNPGHMFEVSINADPAHFLDWDRSLIGQGPTGKRAYEAIHVQPLLPPTVITGAPDAGKWVRRMQDIKGAEQFTSQLNEAGIPGIKYLDQGSRGAGDGSHNYVVFNDKLINIMRKYGIAALPAAGAVSGVARREQD